MDKKTILHIRGYKQDILESIELFKIILNELDIFIDNEQQSIDNMSEYPQFEDKIINMEYLCDKLMNMKDRFEEGISSLQEAFEIVEEI